MPKPRREAVRELMPALFDLLREESEPGVRVVLAHFFFVNVHPYLDGNGRMWRFLMNAMLASGGYRWTVMPLAQRTRYMSALESASVEQDIGPFTDLLAELVERRQGQPPIIIRISFPMMTMSIIALLPMIVMRIIACGPGRCPLAAAGRGT